MINSSDDLLSLAELDLTARQYNKLQVAGNATRFVKGKSGNLSERRKKNRSTADLKRRRRFEHLRSFFPRA